MQVEVIYSQGQLTFAQPVRLKRDHLRLTLTVPDEEMVAVVDLHQAQSTVAVEAQPVVSYADRVNRILAPYRHVLQQSLAKERMDYKAMWKEHLVQKHLPHHEKPDL
jgi:hypothetical protein